MKHLPWWMILSLPEWISSTKGIFCMYKGRVVEMWPSGYLVLLSTDSEAGWRDRRASMTWPICIISVLCFKVWLHSNGYVLCVCVSVPWLCLVAINIIWVELSWVEKQGLGHARSGHVEMLCTTVYIFVRGFRPRTDIPANPIAAIPGCMAQCQRLQSSGALAA